MTISGTELLLIGIVAVALFGYKKLPVVGRNLGRAVKNFKRSLREQDKSEKTNPPPKASDPGHTKD